MDGRSLGAAAKFGFRVDLAAMGAGGQRIQIPRRILELIGRRFDLDSIEIFRAPDRQARPAWNGPFAFRIGRRQDCVGEHPIFSVWVANYPPCQRGRKTSEQSRPHNTKPMTATTAKDGAKAKAIQAIVATDLT